MTTTRTPATIPAADLEPGDRFLNPGTGQINKFIRWSTVEDASIVVVEYASGHKGFGTLDPSTIVNLEA